MLIDSVHSGLLPALAVFMVSGLSMIAADAREVTHDPAVEARVELILSQMTLEEKASMVSGDSTNFDSKPFSRLGIPAMRMTDGPVGVRWGNASVAFPVSVCMAATWNPELIYDLGVALGQETRAKGRNVLLGPCVNIHRTPYAGRNFETFGEDPALSSAIVVPYIKGLQSEGVIATVKHFACNNQEFERHSIDAKVDERTLREIYLPAYKAAVTEAGCWAVMSAYNRLNGHYCSSNTWLLTDILKGEWGFPGFVMSDWGAVHSIVPTLYAGLDIEMPTGRYMSEENVIQAIRERRMHISKLDDKVRRMLRAMISTGIFDHELDAGSCDTPEHRELARKVAREGIVLLKNQGWVLPLLPEKFKTIAVIGPNASVLRTGGGGSSRVHPTRTVSPLEALKSIAGDQYKITFAQGMFMPETYDPVPESWLSSSADNDAESGLFAEYFDNMDFEGEPVFTRVDKNIEYYWGSDAPEGLPPDGFSIRWTGFLTVPETGRYTLSVTSDDGSRLYLNGELLVDHWGEHGMSAKARTVQLEGGAPVPIRVDMYENRGDAGMKLSWQKMPDDPVDDAVQAAKNADVAVLFMGYSDQFESEGQDRESLDLPDGQEDLIRKVAAVNPNTVVVLNCGAGLNMASWADQVPAIINAWYPGQEGGLALADILLGNVNPSGKLITTFYKNYEDVSSAPNYPGVEDTENYAEGIFVGYRHFDQENIEPLFAFGHGLSYTQFEYSDLKLDKTKIKADEPVEVTLTLTNTGTREGAEVVQLYISDLKASVPRPPKELKCFKKLTLKPEESREITLTIHPRDLKFYDVKSKQWIAEPGEFTVLIGSSSRDIRLEKTFVLK